MLTHGPASQSHNQKAKSNPFAQLSPEDSTILSLQRESVAFFELWNTVWKRSQTSAWTAADGKSYAPPFRQSSLRGVYQHCHASEFKTRFESGFRLPGEYAPIRSATAFSICPTWLLSGDSEYIKGVSASEADGVDAAISPSLLDSVRSARAQLIRSFDRAERLLPANSAITGQRVRFLLDQQLRDSAYAVARTCTGDATFCPLLQGYVEVRRGNVRQASALFDSATATLTPTERCGWRDIRDLMPDSTLDNYASLSCTERRQFIAQYWWLADPLYSDPINERLVEHDARIVRMMLLSALPRDERFFYGRADYSPQALMKLVTRYGWPTYLAWGGPEVDRGHDIWMKTFSANSHAPYTTYEYAKGRIHTAPSRAALSSPLSVSDSSWELYDPKPGDRDANWWPDEFMVRARPLLILPTGQIAMLRRENDVLLASAYDLNAPALAGLRAGGVATLLVTPSPDTILRVATQPVKNMPVVRLRGRIPSARTIFALEISDSMPGGTDARTRVGIAPPLTLNAMKGGEIALSDPVILELAQGAPAQLEPGEALLSQMMGSATVSLATNARVGVFFESYGVGAGDTVTISVSVRRRESVSALRRLGMALNVADDPNSSVTISWTEPNPAHVTRTVGGKVPIQARALAVDLSALTPGPYELVTGIKRGAQPEVTSSRRVMIAR